MNGSWLTTKKRGRDDDLIEKDKRTAEEERRRKKGLPPRKHPAKKQNKTTSRKPSSVLEKFVVDDDEVEWTGESSTEEEATKAVTELMSSDSEVSETFMMGTNGTKRTSKPSKEMVARSHNKYIARKQKPIVVNLADDSSSEEELVISPPTKHAKPSAKIHNNKGLSVPKRNMTRSESDDESVFLLDAATKSKYFAATKPSSSSLVDTPTTDTKKKQKKYAPKEAKRMTDLLDSSDDNELQPKSRKFAHKKKSQKKKRKEKSIKMEDYCTDEDEAIAIAAAMEESRKVFEKSPTEQEIIHLQDDESSGGEDFADESEKAKAATSVLDTANKLSALILKTMAKWSNSALEGMIVDGAIALGEAKGRDHTWISPESLKDIVPPEIKLADYQLIGVNWMALLHGMKCEVEGNKTYANVNGILADEMGLGT